MGAESLLGVVDFGKSYTPRWLLSPFRIGAIISKVNFALALAILSLVLSCGFLAHQLHLICPAVLLARQLLPGFWEWRQTECERSREAVLPQVVRGGFLSRGNMDFFIIWN